ncbi:TetR family transcriptional regulator [Parasphingorhabdus pacifica]
MRSALALAAMDLFAAQGFEATTIDQIADVAGVGRRTFFRYFRSKEDVVFPGHDEQLAEVVEMLRADERSESPLVVVSRTAALVLEMYLADPEVSLKRFELTRQVPSLRDKEIASIDGYERVFARYLRERFAGEGSGPLRAAVAASAIVAAHNHVLRQWLKSGGEIDAHQSLESALRLVREALSDSWDDPGKSDQGESDQVVVSVVRTGSSTGAVMKQLEQALRDLPQD